MIFDPMLDEEVTSPTCVGMNQMCPSRPYEKPAHKLNMIAVEFQTAARLVSYFAVFPARLRKMIFLTAYLGHLLSCIWLPGLSLALVTLGTLVFECHSTSISRYLGDACFA